MSIEDSLEAFGREVENTLHESSLKKHVNFIPTENLPETPFRTVDTSSPLCISFLAENIVAIANPGIQIYNTRTQTFVCSFGENLDSLWNINKVRNRPDWVCFSSWSTTGVHIYNWRTQKHVKTLACGIVGLGRRNLITAASTKTDHVYLLAGTRDSVIMNWEIGENNNANKVVQSININAGWIFCIELLPRNRIAAGTDSRCAIIVDLRTHTVLHRLAGHDDWIMSIRLLNSNLLLTGNAEIIAWDLQTMEEAYILRGHTQFVRYLEPINNGTALLSCADDMRIKLWDLEKRELVKTWEVSDRLYAAMQDVNGDMVSVTGSSVQFWRLPTRSKEVDRMVENMKSCHAFTDVIIRR